MALSMASVRGMTGSGGGKNFGLLGVRAEAGGGEPDALAVVSTLVAAGFAPGIDGPAVGFEFVVLGVVAAECDAEEGIGAVGHAPRADSGGDGAGVLRINGGGERVGRIEEDGAGAVARHGAGGADALPIAAGDAGFAEGIGEAGEPVLHPCEFFGGGAVELAVHARAAVAEVRELAVHALAAVAEGEHRHAVWPFFRVPRAMARAPAAANPHGRAPRPPTGAAGIVIIRIGHKLRGLGFRARDEREVAGV